MSEVKDFDVNVNVKDIVEVGDGSSIVTNLSGGKLLCMHSGALWHLNSKDTEFKKIGGGGTGDPKVEGAKTSLGEAKFSGWFCQAEENVYWGITEDQPRTLIKIDTSKGEVEVVLASSGNRDIRTPGKEGFFGAKNVPIDQKAVLHHPFGPIAMINGPKGPQLYFYDQYQLRMADLTTKRLVAIPSSSDPDLWGRIHPPNTIWPSLTVNQGVINRFGGNTSMTWLNRVTKRSTHIIDLTTGTNAVLFDTIVHPLVPLTLNLVVSVEVTEKEEAWIVVVDWTLPTDLESASSVVESEQSRYLLPNERIRRITQLPGAYPYWLQFRFDLSSNTLYTRPKCIKRFSNILEITSMTSSGDIRYTYPAVRRTIAGDLSKLVLQECPLPHDIELTHFASSTTWKVHRDIIRHHNRLETSEGVDRMATVIKYSDLPSSSISAFIKFIYFSSPAELSYPIESFMPLCHCIQLCNQIGMGEKPTSHLLWLLEKKVIPKLPNEFLIKNIMILWFIEQDPSPESVATYSESSPLMNLLASRCRIYVTESEIRKALNEFDLSKTSLTAGQCMLRGTSLVYFLSPNSETKLLQPKLSAFAPGMASQPLEWDQNLSVSSRTPPESPYTYVFTVEGLEKGGITCNALLLYAQWKWFERLIKTENCVEVQTRHVAMLSQFTPPILLAILSVPHGTYRERETLRDLPTRELAVIYRYSRLLQLPESPPFARFVEECKSILFSTVNEQNCIDKLRTFWEAGIEFHSELFVDTLALVIENSKKNSMNHLLVLPFPLLAIIYAYKDNPKQFKSEDNIPALAEAFKLCESFPF